ncbi:MAG TPA: ribosome small subunit-dependent GTPase A [Gemmatimonadales bacterium]
MLSREGNQYRVHTQGGDVIATLRGKAKRQEERAVAGDRVTLDQSATGWAIASVAPRRNVLERRIPGGRGTRPIAANLDDVYVMAATANPEPVLQLLDRLLVLAEANDIPAALIVNKLDLDPGQSLIRRMERAGYEVFPVCVKTGRGLDPLFARMRTTVSVVTGPSGVGKSSLLNALQPGLTLRTEEVSERIGRGKNTTVSAVMIPLDGGGALVDTPGFSDVGLWGLDPRGLIQCFPDLRPAVDDCRFPDCRHLTEPGCAVRRYAEAGPFEASRYESYRVLLAELDSLPEEWE